MDLTDLKCLCKYLVLNRDIPLIAGGDRSLKDLLTSLAKAPTSPLLVRLSGIYNASEIAVNTNPRYVLGDEGRFYQIADNTQQKAFRSYVEESSEVSHSRLRFYINGVDEDLSPEATGIKELDNWTISPFDNSSDNGLILQWYTLDGRRLNGKPVKPGLYIIGGKKVMVK